MEVVEGGQDRGHPLAGIEEVADVVACAEGPLGGCWEYLFQTVDKLAEFELRDGHLDQLADLVRAYPEYRCVER